MKELIEKLSQLEEKIGLSFKNKELMIQAMAHRSYLNENPDFKLQNNERLEFLGDAVLEIIVTEYLYNNYPDKQEGDLTNWRAALVNAKMLSQVSRKIDLSNFLLLSKGESQDGGKARQYILADAFEALIGAIYLDLGYDACSEFIGKYVIDELPQIIEKGLFRDAKSTLQEQAQDRMGATPTYKVLEESGPDHLKHFIVGVFLNNGLVAEGEGSSKQEAEERAAKKALEVKKW